MTNERIDYKYNLCELAEGGDFVRIPSGVIRSQYLFEKQVQDKLHSQLGGKVEVITEAGRIDLLTRQELIEIKKANLWVHGIGQLMVYKTYYPSHKPRLHLFGTFHDTHLAMVIKHCSRLGISLTWEE